MSESSKKSYYKNRDYYLDKMKEYAQLHKYEISEYQKAYRINNKTKLANQAKQHNINNREAISAYHKEYWKNNRIKLLETKKLYRQNNKKAIHAKEKECKYKRNNRVPKWANLEYIKEIYINCPKDRVVDHIVPLLGKNVSGLHVEYNLQYLTPEENNRKNNIFPHSEFH